MNRYVDAEWLIKESMPLSFSVQKWVNEVQIMTAPSIDIVRCGECKYWKKVTDRDGESWEVCNKHMIFIKADDFCSYGEREDK